MAQIRVKTGKQKGKVLLVRGANKIMIGRDPNCGLQIVDAGVSREHAEIFRVGEMVFIRDLGSRNHTFVNDEEIHEELLRVGDVIRVGATQLVFESTREPHEGDVQFEDGQSFKTSLELKVSDLYVLEGGPGGREGELFKAVCQATQIVQSERDEKKVFDRLLDLIKEYIPADHVYLFLRDENTGLITPRAMRTKAEQKNIPISRGILRRVITESRAILTADAMQDSRFKADDSIMMHQIRSVLCVPIQSSAAPIGAIYCVNCSLTETFEQSDLQLISAMGSHLALSLENLSLIRNRRRMFLRTIGRLVSLLEGSSPTQKGHAERVSTCAGAIATEMGLPDRDVLAANMAGLLHDIGKVPAVSGMSPSASERSDGVAHVLAGVEFLKDLPGLADALPGIRAHHEKFDGSGFPDALKESAIPLGGRIVALANDFDKMIYPSGKSETASEADPGLVRKAFAEIDAQAGKLYDPLAVKALFVAYRHGALKSVSIQDSQKMMPAVLAPEPETPSSGDSAKLTAANTTTTAPAVSKESVRQKANESARAASGGRTPPAND